MSELTVLQVKRPGKMGRFYLKNSETAPSDANKRGKKFGGRNNVWREAFDGTNEALNAQ